MERGAKLLVLLTDFLELASNSVELGDDGYYARDGGTEDQKDGAFTSRDGLEGMGGEVLD